MAASSMLLSCTVTLRVQVQIDEVALSRSRGAGVPPHRRPPPLCARLASAIGEVVAAVNCAAAAPPTLETPAPPPIQPARWTIRRLLRWIREQFGRDVGRETLRRVLHALGLSWKKGKKLLAKADPVARAAFLARLRPLLIQSWAGNELLVYIDEAHVHQDADLGYGWAPVG